MFAFLAYSGVEDDEKVEDRSINVKWDFAKRPRGYILGKLNLC